MGCVWEPCVKSHVVSFFIEVPIYRIAAVDMCTDISTAGL